MDNFLCQRRPLDTRPYLRKRLLPGGRSVVTEWRKTAVICGSKLFHWYISRCLQDPVADFFGIFDPRIDWRNDSDEYPASGLEVLSDDLQHACAIRLPGQSDIKVSRLELEQARQKLGVIHLCVV